MRVAVIGAGPAGLMAAAGLAGAAETLIFEGGPRPGRKLLLSGSGRCNFTHAAGVDEFVPRYGDNGRFLRPALHALPPEALVDFFRLRGVSPEIREDGKIFPASGRARDILEALLAAASGARLLTGSRVTAILRDGTGFRLHGKGADFVVDRVVLATGGLSFPRTGSAGDGYELARRLGHSIVSPRPALCGVLSSGFAALAGNAFPSVEASVLREGRLIRRGAGALLFTHGGVSGPVILDLSRHILPGDLLSVNFLHPRNRETFLAGLPALVKEEGAGRIGTFLANLPLSRGLTDLVLAAAGLTRDRRRADLSARETRRLGELLVRFPVPVEGMEGFDTAMATAGGVRLDEVNPRTMESRLVPGLHFAGEVLDIDGDTGGYNLQAAFATGHLAARSILRRAEP